MRNEMLLIITLLVLYGSVLVWFALFGTSGLLSFTVFATIAANIEVLILVQAFGMEMTLGNILFATTFLVTDILSEIAGKKTSTAGGLDRHRRQHSLCAGVPVMVNVFAIFRGLGNTRHQNHLFQHSQADAGLPGSVRHCPNL